MKSKIVITAVALAAFGFANAASAYSLSPKSTNFTAKGKTTLSLGSLSVPCTSTFSGSTDAAGVGHITGLAITGAGACAVIAGSGFPWPVTAISKGKATVSNITVTAAGNVCTGTTTVGVTPTGVFTFKNQMLTGGCVVSGNVKSTPAVTIVNP